MSESVTNDLIYAVMQKMQADTADVKFDVRDLKVCMTIVEEHLGSNIIALSGVNSRSIGLTTASNGSRLASTLRNTTDG